MTHYEIPEGRPDSSYPDAATIAQWEAAAHRTQLDRQRRLASGWHEDQWSDPQQPGRQLDAQLFDSSHRQASAREHQEMLAEWREQIEQDAQDAELIELRRMTGPTVNRGPR